MAVSEEGKKAFLTEYIESDSNNLEYQTLNFLILIFIKILNLIKTHILNINMKMRLK